MRIGSIGHILTPAHYNSNTLSGYGGGGIVLSATPTAFYEFNNNANDSLGLRNMTGPTGTGTQSYVSGLNGQASQFATSNNQCYFTIANDAIFTTSNTNWSWSFWVWRADLTASVVLFNKNFALGSSFKVLSQSGGGMLISVGYNNGSPTNANTSGGTLSASTWTHYVFTKSGGTFTSYTNGVLSNTTSGITGIGDNANDIHIGQADFAATVTLKLDMIGYWNGTALSQSDITKLYNSGAGLSYNGSMWS